MSGRTPTTLAELQARVHAALPQTQCTRCGQPDCAAYAQAVAEGSAGINQCPPGGTEGVARLAQLTGRPVLPLSAAHGTEAPRSMAFIDEDWCIGCTLCLKACPTDAILGANKRMHTVIEAHCTGCELCIPVCPVDCILLEPATEATGWAAWSAAQADQALARYTAHQRRYGAQTVAPAAPAEAPKAAVSAAKSSVVMAALAKARASRKD